MSGFRSIHDMDLTRVGHAESDKAAIARLRPGDVVFGRGDGPVSRIITALDGYWSHSMVYVGTLDGTHMVAESTTKGVKLVPMDDLRGRYPDALGALRPPLDAEIRQAAADWARELMASPGDKQYSEKDLGLSCAFLVKAGGWPETIARVRAALRRQGLEAHLAPEVFESTCSGLVFRSYTGAQGELPVRVCPGLTLEDGVVRVRRDEPLDDAIEAYLRDEAGGEGLAADHLPGSGEVLAVLRSLPGFVAGSFATTAPIERVVSPGDIWQMADPVDRWLFTRHDHDVARKFLEVQRARIAQAQRHAGFHPEALPDDLDATLAERDAWRRQAAADNDLLQFIVADIDRWPNGSTVRVAFLGGDTDLHRRITEAIAPIADAVSLVLDTGYDPRTDQYRTWSEDDTVRTADIRVSFDQPGYWSLVGTASIDPSVGSPAGTSGGRAYQRSLNLGGFDLVLPDEWIGTVQHEFLHALAFKHEHQNSRGPCQDEFRWEDDAGYVLTTDARGRAIADDRDRRPGIYTYLAGAPNHWDQAKVDHNLRADRADDSTAGPFDPESVMLYRFPPLFYRSSPSACAPTGDGQLSKGDRRGLRLLYPVTVSRDYIESARAAAVALAEPVDFAPMVDGPPSARVETYAQGLQQVVGELLRRADAARAPGLR